ncbi:MAG: hypothetical protein KJO54_11220 [Gammaproteobacteria bacterium]|nr:hypothetical protein [Gammaproteobacteria bacterium]NNF59931.1 hypothetical protein [Gammaproteobacteria bacterium]NNM21665.1 hypothetical protein [Gammaproteobacteria bacterium]
MSKPAAIILAICSCVLAGCGTTTVPPMTVEFPTPLIEHMPLAVGVYYDDELRNFTYNETVSDGSRWTIELGESNLRLFDRLFSAMFRQTVEVSDLGAAPPGVAGIIHPVLEEYAFLTPNELGSRFYAVSIRYRVFLYDTQGNELAAWPINAYGQSRSSLINAGKGRTGPLQEATNLAMRDAAAAAIITLPLQPEFATLNEAQPITDESRTINEAN